MLPKKVQYEKWCIEGLLGRGVFYFPRFLEPVESYLTMDCHLLLRVCGIN
jgi:hypothetical protein